MAELTPMQAACWLSRQDPGGVAAHLHVELDGPATDPDRLAQALRKLLRRHPRLRLRVSPDGQCDIAPPGPAHDLHVTDLRHANAATVEAALIAARQAASHARPAIDQGAPARFHLTRLPGGRQRFGVDLDMIAADPARLPLILDDLAADLDEPDRDDSPRLPAYASHAPDPAARDWWRARLADLPDVPRLPAPNPAPPVSSDRLHVILPPPVDTALTLLARQQRVTLSVLMLALFQAVLAAETGQPRSRLGLAMFHRDLTTPDSDRVVDEGANFTLIDARADAVDTLAQIARRAGAEVAAAITHAGVPGVELLRDLSRLTGRRASGPVVFTPGLDLPTGRLLTPRAAARFGRLVWAISQGPGVALDAQVTRLPEGMLLNWDIRLDLVQRAWAQAALDRYADAARRLGAEPGLCDLPLSDWLPPARPLTPLQRAYLLGRGAAALPLGGVAMHEARLYRGDLTATVLRDRAAAMAAAHPALRCRVDAAAGLMRIAPAITPPVTMTDLSALDRDQAEARLDDLWSQLSQRPCDLAGPLWHLHLVALPQDGGDRLAVIARFDGLVLDGDGIARLLAGLMQGAAPVTSTLPGGGVPTPDKVQADTDWWRTRLAAVDGPPRLPWAQPLDQIRAPSWRRTGTTLPTGDLRALRGLAARHGLFANSLMTAAVLEALARFTDDLRLTVALPVAPPPSPERLGSAASFIALSLDATQADFATRARDVQRQVAEGLDHLDGAGVAIGRVLASRCAPVPLPVVVTNGLGWPATAGGGMRCVDGLTQTPQVALDVRLSLTPGGDLRIDLDHAEAAVSVALAQDIAQTIRRALATLVGRDALILTGPDLAPPPPAIAPAPPTPDWLGDIAHNLWGAPPDRPALWHQGQATTFAALGWRVRQAMAGLARHGLREGSVLAICLPRGPDHVAITLAAALSGIVWVPIDAGAPADRRAALLASCAADLVIALDQPDATDPAALMALCPLVAALPDAATLARRSRSGAACYRLFTSGTTGAPKAVVLSAAATGQVIAQTLADWGVGVADVMISVTPLHHDMSMFDLLGAAVAGVPLVLPAPTEARDARAWNRLVAAHGVTLWVSVPAILQMLLDARGTHDLASLRLIAQGGDYIKPDTVATLRRLCPGARLISLGGPTETTIWSIWHSLTPDDTQVIPYGRPLAGVGQRIINDLGEDCPAGVIGRIHTTGSGLALGYWRDGALDQTDFVTLPDGAGGVDRAFRTGDLGRRRRDGVILFAGRTAGYVKIRGVRVSLGDVEAALTRVPGVTAALAVDLPGAQGDLDLGALIVADKDSRTADLRRAAAQLLPDSHVPSRFVIVDALPLSANGKPDRAVARQLIRVPVADAAPPDAAPLPDIVADCLSVLGHPGPADADTPLLSLGLTPAHLKPLSDRLFHRHARRLSPMQLARCATPAALAAALADATGASPLPPQPEHHP
ncbi:AMP-binding protein [Paracoccus sp. p3-h83]|uniref:AMP-binding protein n=1 Tax=Paracoccus sp. p3-h83 TaxID=3342805 RepID=UPI0035B937D0